METSVSYWLVAAGLLLLLLLEAYLLTRGEGTPEERAEKLLWRQLSSQQQSALRRRGYIEISSRQMRGRIYRIPRHGPVAVYDGGRLTSYLCIRTWEPLTEAGRMLVHKVLLEAAERGFLQVAGVLWPGRGMPAHRPPTRHWCGCPRRPRVRIARRTLA